METKYHWWHYIQQPPNRKPWDTNFLSPSKITQTKQSRQTHSKWHRISDRKNLSLCRHISKKICTKNPKLYKRHYSFPQHIEISWNPKHRPISYYRCQILVYQHTTHRRHSSHHKIMEDTGLDTLHRMFICNLAHEVLSKNYFTFNKQLYIQKQGTAIGTRMAPNYAIIFMHYLESNLLSSTPRKPKAWLRFIDDIFMIWPHGIDTLKQFMNMINSYHPTIKFNYDHHKQEIPFWILLYTRQKTTNSSLETTTN